MGAKWWRGTWKRHSRGDRFREMSVNLVEHCENEAILEEAKVEPIGMVMRRGKLELFGNVIGIEETEHVRAVPEMNIELKRS